MKWDIRIHITLATCLKKRKDVLQVNIDQGGCNEKICERIYCSISAVLNRRKTKMAVSYTHLKHAQIIVQNFNESGILPFEVVWKPTLIDSTSIRRTFEEANADEECAGVITWMHTFSPAKSWIAGLQAFKKPLLHLHTQFNEEIPYDTIDMAFMNANQSAHGDREFGHIVTRMGIPREVVVGYYESKEVKENIASWMRSAIGMVESKNIRVVRIADNMRNVAVTEGCLLYTSRCV